MSRETGRIAWPDYARGFAMLCVMLGHAIERATTGLALPMGQSPIWLLRGYLYAFHVPVFFLASGFLYACKGSEQPLGAFLRRRTWSLLMPYVLMGVLVWGGKMVFRQFVYTEVTLRDLQTMFTAPITYLWFFYVLYLVEVLVRLVDQLPHARPALLAASLAAGLYTCLHPTRIDVINQLLFYLPIYCLGMLLGQYRKHLGRWPVLALAVLLHLAVLPVYMRAPTVHRLWWYLAALTGGWVWCGVFLWALRDRTQLRGLGWLRLLGANTLYVYVLHPIVMNAVRAVLMRIPPLPIICWLLLLMGAGVLAPLGCQRLARRWPLLALPIEPLRCIQWLRQRPRKKTA